MAEPLQPNQMDYTALKEEFARLTERLNQIDVRLEDGAARRDRMLEMIKTFRADMECSQNMMPLY